jgi:hypothetical protein
MSDEFDKIMAEHLHDNYKAGVLVLEAVLAEIDEYGYSTVESIKGAIHNRIDVMNIRYGDIEDEGNE